VSTGKINSVIPISTSISRCSIGSPGTGYNINNILYVVQDGYSNARIEVKEVGINGEINYIILYDGGYGYRIANNVSVTGGSGSGALFNITNVSYSGNEYLVGDVVNIYDSGGNGGKCTVTSIVNTGTGPGAVSGVSLTNAGYGYISGNNISTTGGNGVGLFVNILADPNNKLVSTAEVKASSTDTTPGYLDAKVDGVTVQVVNNSLVAPRPNFFSYTSSHTITASELYSTIEYWGNHNASFTLPSAGSVPAGAWIRIFNIEFGPILTIVGIISGQINPTLGAMDEITIIADGDSWYGQSLCKIKATSIDHFPGYLDAKVDDTTITVTDDKLTVIGKFDTYEVKGSATDPTPGYLDAKVDGTSIKLNVANLLTALPSPVRYLNSSYTLIPTDINQIFLITSPTTLTLTLPLANSVPNGSWIKFHNIWGQPLFINGIIDQNSAGLYVPAEQEVTIFSDNTNWWGPKNHKVMASATDPTPGYLDAKVDNSTIKINSSYQLYAVPKAVRVYTSSYTLTPSDVNSVFEMNSTLNRSFTIPEASSVPSGSQIRFININSGTLTINGTINGGTSPNMTRWRQMLVVSDGSGWYSSTTNN
jgi:hypothetical protein